METKKRKRLDLLKKNLGLILGIALLIPPIISVVLFLLELMGVGTLYAFDYSYNHSAQAWTGQGGSTSALPIYFGLMDIAGAYLIKDAKKE